MILATAFDTAFIYQPYSGLVIDCNRKPMSPDAVLAISDSTRVKGNEGLQDRERSARIDGIHRPYHARIAAEIGGRMAAGRATTITALHSFTPTMASVPRQWHIGVPYADGDIAFATAVLRLLVRDPAITVGDNQPYQMDETDYTILRHAVANSLPHVELEIRQDLIARQEGQRLGASGSPWLSPPRRMNREGTRERASQAALRSCSILLSSRQLKAYTSGLWSQTDFSYRAGGQLI